MDINSLNSMYQRYVDGVLPEDCVSILVIALKVRTEELEAQLSEMRTRHAVSMRYVTAGDIVISNVNV